MYDPITPEQIQELQDGEYYWIYYMYPSDEDERLEIGKYDKKLQWFYLCNRTVITPEFVHEVQVVQRPH